MLRGVIDAIKSDIGSTPEGKSWCIKALHPSDPITDVIGVPDQTSAYTTALNFQETVSFGTPGGSGSVETWAADIRLTPGPAMFGSHVAKTTSGGSQAFAEDVNTVFGVNTTEASKAFMFAFERWRLMYCGATIYVDAPQLANQGNIVAAQHVSRPLIVGRLMGQDSENAAVLVNSCPTIVWQPRDVPDYGTIIQMPNSFSGLAKDGVYVPLRLDSNHARWHDCNDLVDDATGKLPGDTLVDGWSDHYLDINTTQSVYNRVGLYPASVAPFVDTNGGMCIPTHGTKYLLPATSQIASVCITGISASATIRIVYRVGIEAQAQPGSQYAPFLKMSSGWDPTAVADYYAISRRLKDAYPSDYNDFGKLWSVIKGAANAVAPVVKMIPGGNLVTGAARLIGGAGDALAGPVGQKDRRAIESQPSAVDKAEIQEAAKEAVAQSMSVPMRRKSRKTARRRS